MLIHDWFNQWLGDHGSSKASEYRLAALVTGYSVAHLQSRPLTSIEVINALNSARIILDILFGDISKDVAINIMRLMDSGASYDVACRTNSDNLFELLKTVIPSNELAVILGRNQGSITSNKTAKRPEANQRLRLFAAIACIISDDNLTRHEGYANFVNGQPGDLQLKTLCALSSGLADMDGALKLNKRTAIERLLSIDSNGLTTTQIAHIFDVTPSYVSKLKAAKNDSN